MTPRPSVTAPRQLDDPLAHAREQEMIQQIRNFGPHKVSLLIEAAVQGLVKAIYHPGLLSAYRNKHKRIDEYSLSRDNPWVLETAFRKFTELDNVHMFPVLLLPAQPVATYYLNTYLPSGHDLMETVTVNSPRVASLRVSQEDAQAPAGTLVPSVPAPVPSIVRMALVKQLQSDRFVPQRRVVPEFLVRNWQTATVQHAENQFGKDKWTFGGQFPVGSSTYAVTMRQMEDPTGSAAHVWPPAREVHWEFRAHPPSSEMPSLNLILEFALPARLSSLSA